MSDLFKGFEYGSKTKRLWLCQNSMQLWYSLHMTVFHAWDREPTNAEQKKIIRAFPNNVDDCRCRECRYHRMYYRRWWIAIIFSFRNLVKPKAFISGIISKG